MRSRGCAAGLPHQPDPPVPFLPHGNGPGTRGTHARAHEFLAIARFDAHLTPVVLRPGRRSISRANTVASVATGGYIRGRLGAGPRLALEGAARRRRRGWRRSD